MTHDEIKDKAICLIDALEYIEPLDAIKILLLATYSIADANEIPKQNVINALEYLFKK